MSGDAVSVGPVALPAPDPPDFGRMVSQRLARLRREMQARDIHGTVLLHGPNVTYATGFVPEAVDASHAYHRRSVAIVSAAGGPARLHPHGPDGATGGTAPLGAASRGGGRAVAAATAGADRRAPLWPELDDGAEAVRAAIFEVLGDCAGRRVAVDAVTGAMARAGVLAGAELVDASRIVGPARVVKTPDELACIDRAQQRTERAMVAAQAACRPGVRRAEVAGAFLVALRNVEAVGGGAGRGGAGTSGMGGLVAPFQNGIDPIFQSMPARRDGGSRTSTGHVAFPTGVDNPAFAEGDLVWVDAGVGYRGYMSDFGRTWVVGRGPNPAEQSLFDRWMAVLEAGRAAVRPGATLSDVGRAARAVEPDEIPWLPQFYLAHATGLESAEMPMIGTDLGPDFDDGYVLEPGMVLVFEPVVWSDGVGGYRAEEIVAVTEDGWRPLGGGHPYEPFQS